MLNNTASRIEQRKEKKIDITAKNINKAMDNF